jgi:hypothetical protein
MHFQIFIPEAVDQNPRILEEVGLADFVQGAEFLEVDAGPSELKGVICAWSRRGKAELGFRPGFQEWIPAVPRDGLPAERFWLGFSNESRCTPSDLARPFRQAGPRLQLGDDNEWMIPVAKQLDSNMAIADDGTWRFEVQRRFNEFYLEYLKWLELLGNEDSERSFMYSDAADFVLSGLRINYRLLPEVASRLGLFTTQNITRALFAILGVADTTGTG